MACSEDRIRALKAQKNSLYRNVNLKQCEGTSQDKGDPGAPSDKDFENAAKTAKK